MRENPFKATALYKLYGVDMIALKSSSVRAAGYNEDFKTLYVEFTSGTTYKYKRVPKEIYIDFMNSRSPGKFVNDFLTMLFNYEPVSGVPRDKRGKSPYERSEEESEAVHKFTSKVVKELMDYQAKIYEEFDNPDEAEEHCVQVLMKMFGSSERISRRQVRNINEMLSWEKEKHH